MTPGYLVEAIGYLLSKIEAQWPDRVMRDTDNPVLPGTYITVRDDHVLWVGDHIFEDGWPVSMLQRVADALHATVQELEAAA
jgi:hypothetical protein